MPLDKTDLMIMEELENDPRQSIRTLARKLEMKWTTVRYRLNRLTMNKILAVSCINDSEFIGHHFLMMMGMKVLPGVTDAVISQLVAIQAIKTVFTSVGRFDILVWVLVRDESSLDHFISKHLAAIAGISTLEVMTTYKWVKDTWSYFKPQTDIIRRYPNYSPNESDIAIIKAMQQDPRQTVTKLAKTVGCSAPVAKTNLERLINDGIIRFVTCINSRKMGYNITVAILIRSKPSEASALANFLATQDTAQYVSLIAGQWQIYFGGLFRDSKHMYRFLTEKLTQLPGVIDYEAVQICDVFKYYVGFTTDLTLSTGFSREAKQQKDNRPFASLLSLH